jgi:undecaprenyl-diphosphatase
MWTGDLRALAAILDPFPQTANAMLDLLHGAAKAMVVAACIYFTLSAYLRRSTAGWAGRIGQRRLALAAVFLLIACAIAIGEDVLGKETTDLDRAILLFLHAHTSRSLDTFFRLVTLTGSAKFLVPLTLLLAIALMFARRRAEALMLCVSVGAAATLVYVIKSLVQRDRPSLWETDWYWGSSFPSGHTLAVAAFATAVALCVIRARGHAMLVSLAAFTWIVLVALSRLELGVHWPTDVLVAACTGCFVPLALDILLDLRIKPARATLAAQARREPRAETAASTPQFRQR